MKKSIIILIILFAHLNVFSQEYVWTVYNIKVDRVNAGQVVSAMDKYLSKPGNLVDGVTVSLFPLKTTPLARILVLRLFFFCWIPYLIE